MLGTRSRRGDGPWLTLDELIDMAADTVLDLAACRPPTPNRAAIRGRYDERERICQRQAAGSAASAALA